ncbi:hypothetical protein [Enterococcus olivae]
MQKQMRHLKKAKTWNTVLLVLCTIGLIFSLISLPANLNPDPSIYTEELMGSQAQQLLDQANSLQTKVYTLIDLVISLVVVVLLVFASKKLKQGKAASKIVYYVYLGWGVIGILYSLLFTPNIDMSGFENVTILLRTFTIGFQLLLFLPAILALIHLFKADVEEH